MITKVKPDSVESVEDGLDIEIGPVTLGIECSTLDALHINDNRSIIFVSTEISDDTITLIGFYSEDRKKLYKKLRKISGIGRKVALLVLSLGEVTDILRAAVSNDSDFFKGIPGLGKTRISRIIEKLIKWYPTPPQISPIPVADWVLAREALGGSSDFDIVIESVVEEGMAVDKIIEKANTEIHGRS